MNKELTKYKKKIFELKNIFYADTQFALLLIFQGIDTAGKDGTIRHILTSMNPMGVQVKSFKQPTEVELEHDFLWRVYAHFPAKGTIEVFNRSYFEDILVASIEKTLPKENLGHWCQLINEVEHHLGLSNIHVLKFFLNISKEVQQKRIKERLTKLNKRWKYLKDDKTADCKWGAYNDVYDTIINKCSKQGWHIIEADKRCYRNYKVAKIITTHLQSLQLKCTK